MPASDTQRVVAIAVALLSLMFAESRTSVLVLTSFVFFWTIEPDRVAVEKSAANKVADAEKAAAEKAAANKAAAKKAAAKKAADLLSSGARLPPSWLNPGILKSRRGFTSVETRRDHEGTRPETEKRGGETEEGGRQGYWDMEENQVGRRCKNCGPLHSASEHGRRGVASKAELPNGD
jgi:hypothetical protein